MGEVADQTLLRQSGTDFVRWPNVAANRRQSAQSPLVTGMEWTPPFDDVYRTGSPYVTLRARLGTP